MGEGSSRLIAVPLAALALLVTAPAAAADVESFTVNSTGDGADFAPLDGTCEVTSGMGDCTLRAAIQESNDADPGAETDRIRFDPTILGMTIQLGAALPAVADEAVIDGCELFSGTPTGPCVLVRGLNTTTDVLSVTAPGVTVRFVAFSNALTALSASGTGFLLERSWFGLDLSQGTAGQAVDVGLALSGDNSTVGSGNAFANATSTGLFVSGDGNSVTGNLVGVKPDGTAAGNGVGVRVQGPANGNPALGTTIGGVQPTPGSCTGPCNVIANSTTFGLNLQNGVNIADATTVRGNFFGIDLQGDLSPNASISLFNANAPNTIVGGPATGDRNYFAGGGTAISAAAQGAPGFEARNNFVGLEPSGTAALGPPTNLGINVVSVAVDEAAIVDNRISVASPGANAISVSSASTGGGGATVDGNVSGLGIGNQDLPGGDIGIRAPGLNNAEITDNTLANFSTWGVSLENADGNTLQGNRMGTDPTGAGDHNTTGDYGVLLDLGLGSSTDNLIGGTTAATENVISNMTGSAIVVRAGANDRNFFSRNRGVDNAGTFIDLGDNGLGNNGVNAPNGGIDAPVITAASDDAVTGTAVPNATVLVFRTSDPGPDVGEIDSFVAQGQANAGGAFSIPVNVPNAADVTALQNDPTGNGSELSASVSAVPDPPETTITARPPATTKIKVKKGKKKKRKTVPISFAFVSSEPGEGGFQCQIDNEQFTLCGSPYERSLGPGAHVFRVRAFDAAGNPDPSLEIANFSIVKKKRKKRR